MGEAHWILIHRDKFRNMKDIIVMDNQPDRHHVVAVITENIDDIIWRLELLSDYDIHVFRETLLYRGVRIIGSKMIKL